MSTDKAAFSTSASASSAPRLVASGAASPPPSPPATATPPATDANSRSLRHLDTASWLSYVAGMAAVRQTAMHPFNVALARKRVSRESISMTACFASSWRDTSSTKVATTAAAANSTAGASRRLRGVGAVAQRASHVVRFMRHMYRGFGLATSATIVGECTYSWTLESTKEAWMSHVGAQQQQHKQQQQSHANTATILNADVSSLSPSAAAAAGRSTPGGHHRCDHVNRSRAAVAAVSTGGGGPPPSASWGRPSSSSPCPPGYVFSPSGMGDGGGHCIPIAEATLVERLRSLWHSGGGATGAAATCNAETMPPPQQQQGNHNQHRNVLEIRSNGGGAAVATQSAPSPSYAPASSSASSSSWRQSPFVRDAVAGAVADCIALFFLPCSVVCYRQMTAEHGILKGKAAYGSVVHTARDVVHHSGRGWRGLFAGLGAQVMFVPSGAMWWGLYGETKRYTYALVARVAPASNAQTAAGLSSSQSSNSTGTGMGLDSTRDNPGINAFCGIVASIATTVVFNPLSVLRTRLQVTNEPNSATKATNADVPQPSSTTTQQQPTTKGARRTALWMNRPYARVAADLVRHEGWRAFFKGAPLAATIAAGEGMMFSVLFEYGKYLGDVTVSGGGAGGTAGTIAASRDGQ